MDSGIAREETQDEIQEVVQDAVEEVVQEETQWETQDEIQEVARWFWKTDFWRIEYAPGLICNKNWEFERTRDLERFYSNKIPYCRCKWYCLKEPITWISVIWIIIVIWLICRYIKKHKKKYELEEIKKINN